MRLFLSRSYAADEYLRCANSSLIEDIFYGADIAFPTECSIEFSDATALGTRELSLVDHKYTKHSSMIKESEHIENNVFVLTRDIISH